MLQILINHYNETKETVRRFLDSLATQTDAEFEALLCSDGGDVRLEREDLAGYTFPLAYAYKPHTGVCNTRNVLMDKATAEYIMFCDVDDVFSKPDGLKTLLDAAEETHADVIGSPYESEGKIDDEIKTLTMKEDIIRVHGKIFRREYLTENNIRFPDEMEISGDMMFLWLVYALTRKSVWIENNFYTWKWNPNSVTRAMPFHNVRTCDRTLRCYTILAHDLAKRNKPALFANLIATTFGMMYVESTNPRWMQAPQEYRDSADRAIRAYLEEFYGYYKTLSESYRRDKYKVMLDYEHAEGLSGPFEGMTAWVERRLSGMDAIIIGYGVVGHNLERELQALKPAVYDKYKGANTKTPGGKYKLAFVCVDTPYSEDNPCDVTEVVNAIAENDAEIYVIKSAVLPGAIDEIREKTGKRIVISPEYYGSTQHCNNFDFDFTILGGDKVDCREVVQILQKVYDGRHQFRITDAKTAALAKYMENCWLAAKVSFCGQFFGISEQLGVDYEELRELFILDPRVNPSHTFVYRDKPYWDSHCLNKDVGAMAKTADAPLLDGIIKFNEAQKERSQVKKD